MSDPSKTIPPIPKETARAANAIFGRSNFYILVGEHLEAILYDIQLQLSLERGGISKVEGATIALITFFQFVEELSDMQASDAVRTRTDWKFALHLSLNPANIYENALCGFRQRILIDSVSQHEFQRLIDRLVMFAPPANNIQSLKSLELISLVCSVNRLNWAQQAMEQVLEDLAVKAPAWLRTITLPHWYGRYNQATPRSDIAAFLPIQKRFSMEEIGADIHYLLEEIRHSSPREISELHEVKVLNQIWSQQFQASQRASNTKSGPLNFQACDTCPHTGTERRLQT